MDTNYSLYYRLSPASRHAIGTWVFWYIAAHREDMPRQLLEAWRYLPYR
jgi:hypothetical protein